MMYTTMTVIQWGQHMGGWGGWGMGFGWLLILVILALVVWAVVRATTSGRAGSGGSSRNGAEELLREQYARGEIDEDTFHRRRDELRRE
ncbi:MAG: SHOCT domain-containing protein [Gemmatimonadota bacterium]